MRPTRLLVPGASYHIVARASRHEMIFDRDDIKRLFLRTVERAKEKYDFVLENFCIMGNHYHFILKPGKHECLSDIMRWIMGVFAQAFNKIFGYWGHVWGDRFRSTVINCRTVFLRVKAYIEENPVKAGLVEDPRDWPWCSLWTSSRNLPCII